MKKLLILLFSFFLLSSPSVLADDISDFEIEGISIGDSLLDYMTEDEILKEIELNKDFYNHLKEPNKYAQVFLFGKSTTYNDGISFFVKNNSQNQYISNKNEKYIIRNVRGMIGYIGDFDSCIEKRNEIVEGLSGMFPNAHTRKETFVLRGDPSGNSLKSDVHFELKSGSLIEVSCDNYEETFRIKNNFSEGLNIVIHSLEIVEWLRDY
jgi:hypothetical protein